MTYEKLISVWEGGNMKKGVRSKFDVPEVRLVRSKRCPQNLCINF